jgi:hypothetical protein
MIVRRVKRVIELGPRKTIQRITQKVYDKVKCYYWKHKAYHGTAVHSWQHITDKHGYKQAINYFYTKQQSQHLSFISNLYHQVDNTRILSDADVFIRNCFNLLGSGNQCFINIPWHTDFRLQIQNPNADYTFKADMFCKNRPIYVGSTKELIKDIKVPWELSRFYHFYVLGKAFEITEDIKYVQALCNHITDWLDNNSYLFGVNWMCPMEVGIRAVNWIVGFDFIKHKVSSSFFERFASSLYDHVIYLENNWEIYDGRTSNHYLSDLIGYFYLCWFFKDLSGFTQKREWCYQELLREWDKQIFNDGTSYEGSTAYHRLVTEIFYHFCLLCKEYGIELPEQYHVKFNVMVDFIEWCTPVNGSLITIGDDDSGRVLWYGLSEFQNLLKVQHNNPFILRLSKDANICSLSQVQSEERNKRTILNKDEQKSETNTKHFPNFGLSLIKNEQWHVSLRYHAYTKRQPSGHHHVDIASITVAINGIKVIADPGSYIYTPSVYWRNYFRSIYAHNSFFITDHEPITVDNRLFALDLPEHVAEILEGQNAVTMMHDLYRSQGLRACRSLSLVNNELVISDWWQSDKSRALDTTWHFNLGPEINIKVNKSFVVCFYDNKVIALIESPDLIFEEADSWFCSQYGSKVPTKRLKARKTINSWQKVVITITTMA